MCFSSHSAGIGTETLGTKCRKKIYNKKYKQTKNIGKKSMVKNTFKTVLNFIFPSFWNISHQKTLRSRRDNSKVILFSIITNNIFLNEFENFSYLSHLTATSPSPMCWWHCWQAGKSSPSSPRGPANSSGLRARLPSSVVLSPGQYSNINIFQIIFHNIQIIIKLIFQIKIFFIRQVKNYKFKYSTW